MASENLSAASPPTRPDAFQGAQFSPNAPSSSHPTYPIPGFSRPQLAPLSNTILSILSSSLSGAGGASFVPNYHGQGSISPLTTLSPNSASPSPRSLPSNTYGAGDAPSVSNYQFQGNISPPSNGRLPNGATPGLLPSEERIDHAQASSPTIQSPLLTQPLAASTQNQINAASYAAPSALNVSPHHEELKKQPSFQLPANNTMSKNRRKTKTRKNKHHDNQYYCKPCQKWVPDHRKKHHDMLKHSPDREEFVCKICEVLEFSCLPLSRKDALKRHIKLVHTEYLALLSNFALRILVPRKKNEREDLGELRQAMRSLAEAR